jgi:hypothetical protein
MLLIVPCLRSLQLELLQHKTCQERAYGAAYPRSSGSGLPSQRQHSCVAELKESGGASALCAAP